jgi:putative transposase
VVEPNPPVYIEDYVSESEYIWKKTTKLNPKADENAVAAKKKRLRHCWHITERKSKQES